MDAKEALSLARQLVDEAGLPASWQERAYGEVLRSLLDTGLAATSDGRRARGPTRRVLRKSRP